jgi:hypothetical protein
LSSLESISCLLNSPNAPVMFENHRLNFKRSL